MTVYRPEERRLVLRLLAYWDELRGERDYPTVGDLEPEVIGDDWACCSVVKRADPLSRSEILRVGDRLRGNLPPKEGLVVADLPQNSVLHHAVGYLDRVLHKAAPMSFGGEIALSGGRALYRSILLPLSEDDRDIDHVLSAANYRLVMA